VNVVIIDGSNISEQERTALFADLITRIATMTYNWTLSTFHGFDGLLDEFKDDIDRTVLSMGMRMPGGKRIGEVDKQLIIGQAVINGLKILSDARLNGSPRPMPYVAAAAMEKRY
jgi:hypothetical protein